MGKFYLELVNHVGSIVVKSMNDSFQESRTYATGSIRGMSVEVLVRGECFRRSMVDVGYNYSSLLNSNNISALLSTQLCNLLNASINGVFCIKLVSLSFLTNVYVSNSLSFPVHLYLFPFLTDRNMGDVNRLSSSNILMCWCCK